MKKKVAVLGANGLLGSDLVLFFSSDFNVIPITRENYEKHRGNGFDLFINANGNSKRFWANQNPQEDFIASTVSVYKSIFDFPSDVYIYISSPDVYENYDRVEYTDEEAQHDSRKLSAYGFHKYLSELIVKKHKEKFLILRSANILGTKLKKGPFFDIINGNPLFITLESRLQLITTKAITEIINTLIEKSVINETINLGGKGTFIFSKIEKYFEKRIQISPNAVTQNYEMNVLKIRQLYPNLKTSEEYLQEFLNGYLVTPKTS